jgi:hypothetical protein
MRKLIIYFLFVAYGCATAPPSQPVSKNIVQKNNDKEEYEITIIDNNFDRWMLTNGKPVNFYDRQYYRSKNAFYATSWNSKVSERGRYNARNYPFEEPINYNPAIDYGLDVDYKLFWYFKYIESVFGRRYNFPN